MRTRANLHFALSLHASSFRTKFVDANPIFRLSSSSSKIIGSIFYSPIFVNFSIIKFSLIIEETYETAEDCFIQFNPLYLCRERCSGNQQTCLMYRIFLWTREGWGDAGRKTQRSFRSVQLNLGRDQRNVRENLSSVSSSKSQRERKEAEYRHARTMRCRKNDKVSSR